MDNRFRAAFGRVQASGELKDRTQAYLLAKMRRADSKRRPLRWALAGALAALLLTVGAWLYLTPVSAICIRVNPELDLQVNRFGVVVGAVGRNQEGRALAEDMDLRFMGYTQAVEKLLDSETLQVYTQQGREVFIEVVCGDQRRSGEMLANLEGCTQKRGNVHCHAGAGSGGHGGGHGHGYGHGRHGGG